MKKYLVLGMLIAAFFGIAAIGWSKISTQTVSIISAGTKPIISESSLIGTWLQKSGMPGVKMTATITEDKIDIFMESAIISAPYYVGTLIAGSAPGVFTSKPIDTPMLSSETSKVFDYNNGVLSFNFTMEGRAATIELIRSVE